MLARDLCAHPTCPLRAVALARVRPPARARTCASGAVDARRDLRSEEGAIERDALVGRTAQPHRRGRAAAVAAVELFLAAVVDGCAAPQHERLGARGGEALENPHASGDVRRLAAHDERRTTAFDALANAAEEEDSSLRAPPARTDGGGARRGAAAGAAPAGAARHEARCGGARGQRTPSPAPPRPALSKLVSLGSSKRLFGGPSLAASRIDSPSRPKTPKGAKQGSSKWARAGQISHPARVAPRQTAAAPASLRSRCRSRPTLARALQSIARRPSSRTPATMSLVARLQATV